MTLQTQPLQLNSFNSFANTQHPHSVQNGMPSIPDRPDRNDQERTIMLELLQILVKDRSEIRAELSFLRSQVISISEQITSRPWFSNSRSLGPNDSVSRNISADSSQDLLRPANRPPHLPQSVLWTREDAKNDPHIKMSPTNMSRFPMEKVIRHPDGTLIDKGTYGAISDSTRTVSNQLLSLPDPTEVSARAQKKGKKFFQTWHPKELASAIRDLESMQPLLQLCAGHWKAEAMLAPKLSRKLAGNSTISDDEIDTTDIHRESQKRPPSPQPSGASSPKRPRIHSKFKGKKALVVSAPSTSRVSSIPTTTVVSSLSINPLLSTSSTSSPAFPASMSTTNPSTLTANSSTHADVCAGPSASANISEPPVLSATPPTPPADPSTSSATPPTSSAIHPMSSAIRPTSSAIHPTPSGSRPMPSADLLTLTAASPSLSENPLCPIDVSFIEVSPAVENLRATFSTGYDTVRPNALKFLNAITPHDAIEPSQQVLSFLHRIENTDPNDPEFDEDNSNVNWGHRQFTSGGMRISTVLQSWDQIGSTTACRLIAAALKTGRVAQFMCSERNISATSYLADAYLNELVGALLTAKMVTMENDARTVTAPPSNATTDPPPLSLQDATSMATQQASLTADDQRKQLQPLTKDELKDWLQTHAIPIPTGRQLTKENLIRCVLDAPCVHHPSAADINSILSKRTRKGRKAG